LVRPSTKVKIFARIRRYSFTAGHCLFATVVAVRLVALAHLSASPFLLPARGDMHFYNDWAQRILRGELSNHLAFYGLPLYAYLLAFIYKLFGYGPFVPAFLQALLDAGTAVLIYRLTLLVLPARSTSSTSGFRANRGGQIVALLAGLAWAFFVPAQAYAVILMPTAWLVFVFWFVVWRIVKTGSAPTPRQCLLLGLLLGFTAMGVATILFLIPLILAALWLKPHKIDNRKWAASAAAGLLLLGVIIGTSPCWIHNYFIARDPVFLSAHSGINFWIGNNPDANGYPRFPPGLRAGQAAMLEDSITVAESAAGHSLKRAEVSAFWSSKAQDYITHHFGEWLRLLATKFRNFWSAFQYDDLSIITSLRENGVIFPGLYFGVIAAFALPGIFLGWVNASRSRWIAFAILLYICALLPVFVTERYRLPVVPGLLVFAAIGLSIFWQSCLTADLRGIALYCALLVSSTIFVSWPQRNPSLWALDAYNSGWQALEANDLALAEKKLSLARAYVPDNAETNFAFGNLRLAQGNRNGAASFYRETLRIDPRHKGTLNNLGVIALEAHDLAAARLYFQHALAQDRHSAKTHFLLAKTADAAGDLVTAENEIAQALEIAPTQPEFLALKKELALKKQPASP
jgi:hypothetical protein